MYNRLKPPTIYIYHSKSISISKWYMSNYVNLQESTVWQFYLSEGPWKVFQMLGGQTIVPLSQFLRCMMFDMYLRVCIGHLVGYLIVIFYDIFILVAVWSFPIYVPLILRDPNFLHDMWISVRTNQLNSGNVLDIEASIFFHRYQLAMSAQQVVKLSWNS